MSPADIGPIYASGIFILLAVGALIWGGAKFSDKGLSIAPILAFIGAIGLIIVAFMFYMSGVTIGW